MKYPFKNNYTQYHLKTTAYKGNFLALVELRENFWDSLDILCIFWDTLLAQVDASRQNSKLSLLIYCVHKNLDSCRGNRFTPSAIRQSAQSEHARVVLGTLLHSAEAEGCLILGSFKHALCLLIFWDLDVRQPCGKFFD